MTPDLFAGNEMLFGLVALLLIALLLLRWQGNRIRRK